LPNRTNDGVIHGEIDREIERANRNRAHSFSNELNRLREVCARAINPGYGYDSNYDRIKHFCAAFAKGLVCALFRRPITGTMDGPFRAIASLLYEAVSGRRHADLKRACDSQLREIRDSTIHIYPGAAHLFDQLLDIDRFFFKGTQQLKQNQASHPKESSIHRKSEANR
jgi:hypothetical protein